MTNYEPKNPYSGNSQPQNNGGHDHDNQDYGLGDQGYGQSSGGYENGYDQTGNAYGNSYGQSNQGYEAFPNAEHQNNLGMQQAGQDRPGAGSRFLAFFIDSCIVGIISSIITFLFFSKDFSAGLSGANLPFSTRLGAVVISIVIWYAYRVTMEAKAGGSLGRMATGTRVIKATGEPIDFATSAKRNIYFVIAGILNLIPFVGGLLQFVLYIAIGVSIANSPTRQSFTDKPAPALVVKK